MNQDQDQDRDCPTCIHHVADWRMCSREDQEKIGVWTIPTGRAQDGSRRAERMANRERQRIGLYALLRRPPLCGRVEARLWWWTRQARSWGQGGACGG